LKEVHPLIVFLVPCLARFPIEPLILEAAALLDLRNGNPALAERRLRLALAYLPESPSLNNSLAIALAQQEKIQEATEIFQNVANSDARGQLNLAKTFLEGGQAQAALDTLDRYAALETKPASLTMYGIALARLGRDNEGEAALERALDLDPQSDTATQALSLIKQQNKITAGQPIQLSAKARIHFDRGMFALEQNRWLDAADAFSVAQEMQPIPILSFYQGYALHLSRRHRDAVESYSTAAQTFRESDIVLNNLGYAYLQIGRYDLALINLKKASQLNPSNSSAFLNLGLTQFGLGQYSEALTSWDQAESLNPTLSEGLFNYRIEAEERIRP
ncbi:tetratricopeptide repeat protein, partial [Myxococcota bacterium]|nr:tetratricopeptide repeat protein [Myxococcota bacterium]